MGNGRQFNFDSYIDEILTEALSLAQMQDQIKQVGLDPAKYDQKHFLFLVGLINANQGIEVYDELLSKIKDKGLLNSLLSVSVNDRRSDKPMVDMDKVGRALENPENPNELRAIISGQKREIVKTEEPQYDSSKLKEFLSKNNSEDLLDILIKLKAEVDGTLQQFITEYQQSDEEIKRYVKTNAHRATNVLQLAGILHEAKSKNLNPFNASTSLTVEDLRRDCDFYNLKKGLYIIRTTYPDDPNKSIKLNLKYGQGNRFGLCISSKTNNYYLAYRVEDYLTTYFVYRIANPYLDEDDIDSYNIAIIDSILDPNADENDQYTDRYSYNPVATMTSLDPTKFEYDNTDTRINSENQMYSRLSHIFQEDEIVVESRNDNRSYTLNKSNFRKIFKPFELSPHEMRLSEILSYSNNSWGSKKDTRFEDEFFSLNPKDQIILLIAGADKSIDEFLFKKLSPEVRDFFVKNTQSVDDEIYYQYNEKEKQFYKKSKISFLNKKYEKWGEFLAHTYNQTYHVDYKDEDIDQELYKQIYSSSRTIGEITTSLVDVNIIKETPELYKKFVEPHIKYAEIIKNEVMEDVDGDGVYHGDLDLSKKSYIDARGNKAKKTRDADLRFVLPDLSDVIVKGDFKITDMVLNSLKGCPKVIMGDFEAYSNNLKSLEGGPEVVGRNYRVNSNKLETLQGCASIIKMLFDIRNNKTLKNLKGCPEYLYGLDASNCELESLEGGPKRLVTCNFNGNKLTSLEHGPEIVMQNILFSNNPLTSIKGYPKYVHKTDIEKLSNTSLKYIIKELGLDNRPYLYSLTTETIEDLNIYNIEQINRADLVRLFDPDFARVDKDSERKIQEVIQQNRNKRKQINKESLLYNLMKSYLLRS
jgi:hypothetical protein